MKGFFELGSPMIALPVDGNEIAMLFDTSFTGHVMLPRSKVSELGLDQIGVSDYLTASGTGHVTKVYLGKVSFLGEEAEVPILSTDADFALAGMELFGNSRIILEKRVGLVEVAKSERLKYP